MKLNVDFSQLYSAVDKMGAELIKFTVISSKFIEPDIDEILGTTGQEIDLNDLESYDNLLSFKDRQVLLYIPDQGSRIESVLDNSQNGTKFHVAECKTLQDMKSRNRFDRYIVTNNLSGTFNINGIDFNGKEVKASSELHVCKNCLTLLNYKNYKQNKSIFNSFSLEEFFETYSTLFLHFPKFENESYDSNYSDDWDTISKKYRTEKKYICETCDTSFIDNKKLLHTHHINGIKSDNSKSNFKAVCIDCHRKEPNHKHVMLSRVQLERIYTLRREQNKINIKSWNDVFKYADIALHNYIHLLKDNVNMKLPEVGYIIETDNKKIILDLAWITASKKSALVSEYTSDYFSLDDWTIQILSDAIYNFNERDFSKKKDTFKIEKNKFIQSNTSTPKFINIEKSTYSKDLYEISLPTFEKIKRISSKYIEDGNANNSNYELCKYISENGKRDKALMYSLFDEISKNYINKSINIIDWQCNQAMATSLFLDYIREKQVNIKINKITLVESDENNLKRALLHVDVLKDKEVKLQGINNNFTGLKANTIDFNTEVTIHFYSTLLNGNYKNKKISLLDSAKFIQKNENYFICTSESKDKRIDDFYNYCNEKYEVKLILANDSKVGRYTKYEKLFLIGKN